MQTDSNYILDAYIDYGVITVSYQSLYTAAEPFMPMPNTGTILDISAGSWVEGERGQTILNGGVAHFAGIAALPNMFKTTIAAGMAGAVLRAFPAAIVHAHDTETTMQHARIEELIRRSMNIGIGDVKIPENLESEGRLFFTSSVDHDGTDIFNLLKKFCKSRRENEKKIQIEIINPRTKKLYEYYNPVIEFWDSFSGLKTKDASDKQSGADVGTKDTNMLAMNFNKGKSDIVEQAPDLTAKHGVYLCFTAHVGQKYQLDMYKPEVKPLRWLKGDVKLKRIPENTSFNTGNFYVIGTMNALTEKGADLWPRTADEKEDKSPDLIDLSIINQRGKYGFSNNPLPLVVSQREGLLHAESNFLFLRQEDKYGIGGNNVHFHLALTPDVSMRRTTVRTVFREQPKVVRAAQILMEMCYMFKYDVKRYEEYFCSPEELYEEIKNLGYDWDLLLATRFWFTPVGSPDYKIPFISTMDLLKMRLGQYHPYWYPVAQKNLLKTKGKSDVSDPKGTAST